MNNVEKIKDMLSKEQSALEILNLKKNKIEKQIKESELRIDKFNNILEQKRFSEANYVLHAHGISLEELTSALTNGNILSFIDKIQNMPNNKECIDKTESQ